MVGIRHILFGVASVALLAGCKANTDASADVVRSVVTNKSETAGTFDQTLNAAKVKIDDLIGEADVIPVPKDAGGGYTHEKHKDNAKLMFDAGALYEITGEKKYADYAKRLMTGYADVYPEWGTHPAKKEQSPGRMFWQNLNESWWLVHVAQSFDAIKSTLSEEEYSHIETNLLRNMAQFLSEGSPTTFDKVHNHGTWATTAVGLTGYALGDQEYVEKALLGLDKSGTGGFLRQLDELFSPDGYYNEGPYYQRYALMPFVLFGQAIQNNEPERKIFEHRDGILKKAIYATIQLSYNGLFFPINDAIKDKDIATTELLHGVAIAYDLTGDNGLLSISEAQGKYVLTPVSKAVADAIDAGKTEPFDFRSLRYSDGASGQDGALDILRDDNDPKGLVAVVKNTSQGLGHGHFDKQGLLVYDRGYEILRDYGAARFLNVEAKYGGHYLPENNAYAKQTVAHNALVVDKTSHFNGDVNIGNQFAPDVKTFSISPELKITSSIMREAYDDVELKRTVAMVKDAAFEATLIIDLVEADAEAPHLYDLPFHYNGQLIETNFEVKADPVRRKPLDIDNGYQYLWQVAETSLSDDLSQVTFLKDRRFYTVSSAVPVDTEIIFIETGANDPNFNLRREPGFVLRALSEDGVSFANVFEPHGEYNPTVEYTLGSHTAVKDVSLMTNGGNRLVVIVTKSGDRIVLAVAGSDDADAEHTVATDIGSYSWSGPYKLFHSKKHKMKGETQ